MLEKDLSRVNLIIRHCTQIMMALDEIDSNYYNFTNNWLVQNSVSFSLLQIGELTKQLSDDFKTSNNGMKWRQISGLRDIIAHQYGQIDLDTIYKTALRDIPDLKNYLESIK